MGNLKNLTLRAFDIRAACLEYSFLNNETAPSFALRRFGNIGIGQSVERVRLNKIFPPAILAVPHGQFRQAGRHFVAGHSGEKRIYGNH
jgi:hypothetical protein